MGSSGWPSVLPAPPERALPDILTAASSTVTSVTSLPKGRPLPGRVDQVPLLPGGGRRAEFAFVLKGADLDFSERRGLSLTLFFCGAPSLIPHYREKVHRFLWGLWRGDDDRGKGLRREGRGEGRRPGQEGRHRPLDRRSGRGRRFRRSGPGRRDRDRRAP